MAEGRVGISKKAGAKKAETKKASPKKATPKKAGGPMEGSGSTRLVYATHLAGAGSSSTRRSLSTPTHSSKGEVMEVVTSAMRTIMVKTFAR
jgi:hypothetical protein